MRGSDVSINSRGREKDGFEVNLFLSLAHSVIVVVTPIVVCIERSVMFIAI